MGSVGAAAEKEGFSDNLPEGKVSCLILCLGLCIPHVYPRQAGTRAVERSASG
jgi:hypothetical protein